MLQVEQPLHLESFVAPNIAEAPAADQALHARFEKIAEHVDAAFATIAPEAQEQFLARPAGRKIGGAEDKRWNWAAPPAL